MKYSIQLTALTILSASSFLGCETRVGADIDNPNRVQAVPSDPVVVEQPRRDVDADINITGPRGNGVRVDVDGDAAVRRGAEGDVDVRVDADRPILPRNRDVDGDDVRVRETPRGVKVDVRD